MRKDYIRETSVGCIELGKQRIDLLWELLWTRGNGTDNGKISCRYCPRYTAASWFTTANFNRRYVLPHISEGLNVLCHSEGVILVTFCTHQTTGQLDSPGFKEEPSPGQPFEPGLRPLLSSLPRHCG